MSSKDQGTNGKDELLQDLCKALDAWKTVVLPLYDFLIWKQQHNAFIIGGCISLCFGLYWYFAPSVLTSVAAFGIIASLLDFTVPELGSKLFAKKWTSEKQQQYEALCQSLLNVKKQMQAMWDYVKELRTSQPKKFMIAMVTALIFVGYVGSLIDNLCLSYITALFVGLLPGLCHHGLLQKQFGKFCKELKLLIDSKILKRKVQ